MKEKKQCEETVFDNFRNYQCNFTGIVERDGKWYCGVCDPVRRKEKQDARDKKCKDKYEANRKSQDKANRRREAETHYCENLTTEYLETHQAGEK